MGPLQFLQHHQAAVAPSFRSESRNTAVVFRGPKAHLEVEALAGPPRGFRTRIVSSRPLTPSTRAIEPEKPAGFTFGPTQFTFLQLQTEEGMDARPMSLATSPTRPHLEYAVRCLSGGRHRNHAPQGHGRICRRQRVAHPDPARLQQPERGRNRVSTRTRFTGKAEPTLPSHSHPNALLRPNMEGRNRTD